MFLPRRKLRIETERHDPAPADPAADFRAWSSLREQAADFLTQWEPAWASDHLSRKGFTNRVYWAQRSPSAMAQRCRCS